MPWSGSSPNQTFGRTDGTRSGATTWQEADGAGVDIIATDHDTHDQDLAAGINAALKKDGGNSPSANLPMAGFVHTNVGLATALTHYLSATQAFKSIGRHVSTVGGTANAVTLTTGFSLTAYTEGMTFQWKVPTAITGPLTVDVDGLGAKDVVTLDGSALQTGEIRADFIPIICYDGTRFRWLNKPTSGSSGDILARITPIGIVAPWPGATAPSGWLFAYGQAVSRTTYSELFAAYGTTYGTGDGSTTFNLPDYRGRTPFGDDNMGGSTAGRITAAGSGITGTTLGAVGGAETVTLSTSQIPAHGHTGTTDNTTATVSVPARAGVEDVPSSPDQVSVNIGEGTVSKAVDPHGHTFTTNNAGGGLAHNNMPPAIIQNWIILALPALASAATTGVNGLLYQFSNSTGGAPGDGKLAFDHATISSATGFRISETDATGAPMGPVLATWDDSTSSVRGTLYVYKVGTLSTYAVFQVTGSMTDSGAYDSFSATYVSANGTFADGDQISVIYVPKGDKGDVGAGIDWQGAWITATAYALADGVKNGGSSYICISPHTSGASTEPGVGASWATVWDVIAERGIAGIGTGDMLASANLADVANAATAFGNIKQAATETATGVVELATTTEATTGTDTTRAVTPAGLAAHVDASAHAFKTIAVSGQSDVVADSRTDTLTLAAGSNITITTNAGTDTVTIAASGGSATAPTRQTFTSGSGTYTTPANVVWVRVRMIGGGGGGGGSGTSPGNGGAGGNTTFSTFTASGGNGSSGLAAGAGGAASGGTINTAGGRGGDANNSSSVGSGYGGSSLMGPGAGPAVYGGSVGRSATANTGGGGSGGTASGGVVAAAGGGAGGYVEAYIASPSASYSYAIGAAGTAGTAGSSGSAGGAGGSGYIIVEEFY